VYLGGVPPNLPATATLVSTPLQPNRWRNDVANGPNSYAWWQFNPLSMDIEVGVLALRLGVGGGRWG
jgi:hypothetical protein